MSQPKRILLLDTGNEWGGGTNSMFELLKRLDRNRCGPSWPRKLGAACFPGRHASRNRSYWALKSNGGSSHASSPCAICSGKMNTICSI